MSFSCETLSQKSRAPSASCCVLLNFSESSTRTRYDCEGEERSNVSVDRGWRDGSGGIGGRGHAAREARVDARDGFARTSSIVTTRSSAMVACRATVTLARPDSRRKLVFSVSWYAIFHRGGSEESTFSRSAPRGARTSNSTAPFAALS